MKSKWSTFKIGLNKKTRMNQKNMNYQIKQTVNRVQLLLSMKSSMMMIKISRPFKKIGSKDF
jgi:hypothetical protein